MLALRLIDLLNTIMVAGEDDDADADDADTSEDAGKEADASDAGDKDGDDGEGEDDEEKVSLKDYRKLRSEAALYRKQLRTLEEKVDASTKAQEKAAADAEIAKLEGVEAEKARTEQANKELAEANAAIATKDAKLKADAINTAVYRAANAAGFENPEDAPALLDLSGIEVSDGEIDNDEIDELVKTLADSKPYLLKEESANDTGTGPTNPPNPKRGPKVRLTGAAEIEKLKQQSAEARERGDMVSATKLYNRAWELERGVKPGG